MNLVADECAERTVNELMPRNGSFALELLCDDQGLEMGVVVTRNSDRGIVEARLDQPGYVVWIHNAGNNLL